MCADFRVFHVRSSAGLYGAEYVILGLVPELAEAGIGCTVLCLDNQYMATQPLADKARTLRIPCERIPCRGRFDFATVAALRRVIAENPRALLHVHDYKSALNAWLARGRSRVPIVATSHGQFSSTASLQLYHRLELSLMRRFERVCIVSDAMRPKLLDAGVRAERLVLIENGIDTRRFRPEVAPVPRSALGIADGAVVFGAAMRLTEQKNPLGLVDAFARVAAELPHAVLVVAGDGPLRAETAARAEAHGVAGRVRLLGACDDLERIYATMDVFVLPSLYEGLPLALLEAMAAARQVVATRVGEVPAVLAGTEAILVAPADIDALAGAMLRAAMHSPPAASLRERAVKRYSVARMAKVYEEVYRDVWRCRELAAA
ncbi:MAG TPA: glycosyltransferase [Rudaea sp.]|nr:glycosyltransferase [Rudaea sp.]